jgi:radical SAM superfamily enzyme YgiQ (UPF0313 family)
MHSVHGLIFTGFTQKRTAMPSAGAYRLRTHLEKHSYPIEVVDYFDRWSADEILDLIKDRINPNFKFIGFSLTFLLITDTNLLQTIKQLWPNVRIIIGSQEPPRGPDELLTNVDVIFYGHAENALLAYLRFLEGKQPDFQFRRFDNGTAYVISDKDAPYTNTGDLSITWKKGDPASYISALPIEISRGCIFKCKFCSYPLLGKKKMDYIRDVDNLADEFKRNHDDFGIKSYLFADDTFNDSNYKLEMVKKAIARSGVNINFSAYIRYDVLHRHQEQINTLCEMGLHTAVLGIETFNEQARKSIGKGLTNDEVFYILEKLKSTKKDLWVNNGFIIGLPGETIADVTRTNEWLLAQNYKYLDGWNWERLYIGNNLYLMSEFQRESAKYGYTPTDNYNHWTSGIMDSHIAQNLANEFNKQKEHIVMSNAFSITNMLSLGFEIESLVGKLVSDIDFGSKADNLVDQYKRDRLHSMVSLG